MYKLVVMLTAVAVPAFAASPAMTATDGQASGGAATRLAGSTVAAHIATQADQRSASAWNDTPADVAGTASAVATGGAAIAVQAPPAFAAAATPDGQAARAPPT